MSRFKNSREISKLSSFPPLGSGVAEDVVEGVDVVGVLEAVDRKSPLSVGVGVAESTEFSDEEPLGPLMSELSEFERAGRAIAARNSAEIVNMRLNFDAFTFAPFARFDHRAGGGLDSRPCPDFSGSCVLCSEYEC